MVVRLSARRRFGSAVLWTVGFVLWLGLILWLLSEGIAFSYEQPAMESLCFLGVLLTFFGGHYLKWRFAEGKTPTGGSKMFVTWLLVWRKRAKVLGISLIVIAAAGGVVAVVIAGYDGLNNAGWITHNHDTPVWIQGEWMVGEYRICQLRTTTPLVIHGVIPPGEKAELPRLFCGRDSSDRVFGSAVAFEDAMPDPVVAENVLWRDGDWHIFDSYFHVLPVRYNGRIARPDKLFVSWRCQRQGSSLLSSAGITCNAIN